MRRPLACVLVLSCALTATALAGPRKKKAPAKPAPTPAEKLISQALDGAEEKVGGCVLESASAGAWTKVVKVKVSLNGAGQMMNATVAIQPVDESAAKTQACVEAVLQATAWPKSGGPLATAEREWTFSTEAR
ncbi:MAG: hypothetical protein AB1938_13715 [Myxococcota bacterium]